MKRTIIFFGLAISGTAVADAAATRVREAAFEVIRNRIGRQEFKPSSADDVTQLRTENNGIVDFLFTSKDGLFRGDAYCQYFALLRYRDGLSDPGEACFRINVFENDPKGVNRIGRQVGIY